MNKKLFFLVLPALMALSGCSGASQQKANVLLEDTLAHEEIFGDAQVFEPIKINTPYKLDDSSSEPTAAPLQVSNVGVQYQRVVDGYCAIRYVAAISDLNVTATWTRNICESNGNRRKTENNHFECKVAYSALSENGGVAFPEGVGSQYKAFVVYTLRNIPESDVDSYLFGYLTVSNASETVKTDARIARVGGNNTFTIDTNSMNGYFVQGQINGRSDPVLLNAGEGNNYAQKEDLSLRANDTFGVFKYVSGDDEHFQCFGYNQLRRGAQFLPRVAASNYIQTSGAGTYKLYLTNSNEIHIVVPDSGKTSGKYYFVPGYSWGTSARYAINAFNNSVNPATQIWIPLTQIGTSGVYTCDAFNAEEWPEIQFVRLNPNTSSYNWDGDWWSKTGNLSSDDAGNIFYVDNDASTDRGNNAHGTWNLYLA